MQKYKKQVLVLAIFLSVSETGKKDIILKEYCVLIIQFGLRRKKFKL